jgi:hypothetical protein
MFAGRQIKSKLDEEILAALEELDKHESTSEAYGVVVENIAKLYKLKSEERLKRPSLDTVLVVGANIFGILWLARYERDHVVNSKAALGFVMKPR